MVTSFIVSQKSLWEYMDAKRAPEFSGGEISEKLLTFGEFMSYSFNLWVQSIVS